MKCEHCGREIRLSSYSLPTFSIRVNDDGTKHTEFDCIANIKADLAAARLEYAERCQKVEALEKELARTQARVDSFAGLANTYQDQRDRLAGLLRECLAKGVFMESGIMDSKELRERCELALAALPAPVAEAKPRPTIVCLCGSGRFREAFERAEYEETLQGSIVLTIGCNTKDIARSADLAHHKPMLDELHKRKIDLCDEILVLNVGGYIGESTRSEIAYAEAHQKRIRWLESPTSVKAKPDPRQDPRKECAYCNKPILAGQPTAPDVWGVAGARLHLDCATAQDDGDAIDNKHGDN